MFSSFRAYDDEGYYLVTLNDYLAGQPLLASHTQVYGPFFYELYGGLFRLFGLAPDNDTGRLLTAVSWLLATLLSGLVAYRLTRNLWLGIAAQLLTFSLLSAMTNEPMGTYGIVSILLLVVAGAAIFRPARPRAAAVVIGASVAALCLIKINIGGLAAVAVVLAWAAGLRPPWRRPVLALLVGATALLPFLLMSALLADRWVLDFALVVALSIAAVGLRSDASMPVHSVPWFAAGGAVVAAASITVALSGGTRPGDLWTGLVVAPLRFPQLFVVPLAVNPVHVAAAALSLGAAVLVSMENRPVHGLVRVAAGFFALLSLVWMPNAIFMAALPLAWIATRGPAGVDDPAGPYARVLIPALAVLETLQAYPIAGTQASMAGLGMIPVGTLILGDGVRQLERAGLRRAAWAPLAPLAAGIAVVAILALTATAAFANGTPLGVPGAERMRLPAQQVAGIRSLVAAIDQECSSFITLPSMSSLYVWTGQSPPTSLRVPIWWLIVDSGDQRTIAQQLASAPRLCVVENSQVLGMRSMGRAVPSTPLVDFIGRSFEHQGSYGDYELLVRSTT